MRPSRPPISIDSDASTRPYESPRTVDGIADMEVGRAAWFKDPDGNLIGMIQLDRPFLGVAPRSPVAGNPDRPAGGRAIGSNDGVGQWTTIVPAIPGWIWQT